MEFARYLVMVKLMGDTRNSQHVVSLRLDSRHRRDADDTGTFSRVPLGSETHASSFGWILRPLQRLVLLPSSLLHRPHIKSTVVSIALIKLFVNL